MRSSIVKRPYIAFLSIPAIIVLAIAAVGQPPDDVELLLSEAETYLDEGVYDKAAAAYARVLETNPENEQAIYGYTHSLLALDERRALDYLKGEIAQNPGRLTDDIRVELASLWCRRGKVEEALELLNDIDAPGARAARGKAYLFEGDSGPAIKELKTAYVQGEPDARFFLAEALIAEGRYPEAIERLNELVEEYPYLPEVYGALGEAYHRSGLYDEALEQYDIALGYDATCRRALANKGRLSFEQGDYGSAIKYYNEILIADPWDAAALYNLALVYEKVDRSVARTKWTQFIEMYAANPREARRVEKAEEKLGIKK